MRRVVFVVGSLLAGWPLPTLAAIQCPQANKGAPLKAFSVFEGNPDENAGLAPDSSRRVGGGYVNVYNLEPGARLIASCLYANDSEIRLKLPQGLKTCRSAGKPSQLRAGCE